MWSGSQDQAIKTQTVNCMRSQGAELDKSEMQQLSIWNIFLEIACYIPSLVAKWTLHGHLQMFLNIVTLST